MSRTRVEIMCMPDIDCQDMMIAMETMGFTRIREVFNHMINITANIEYDNSDDLGQKINRLQSEHKGQIMQITYRGPMCASTQLKS